MPAERPTFTHEEVQEKINRLIKDKWKITNDQIVEDLVVYGSFIAKIDEDHNAVRVDPGEVFKND